jgi:sugar phosphate isomerase/epimerase
MMNFGFSTYFFVKDHILGVLDRIASAGVRTIEISDELPHALNIDGRVVDKIEKLRRSGVEFSLHAPFFEINLGSFFEDIREISKGRIMEAVDLAARLGCDPVVVHPGYNFLRRKVREVEERAKENFLSDLKEITEYAGKKHLRVALENLYMPFFFFYDLDNFQELRKRIPTLGIALDLGHAYMTKRAKGEKDPEGAIIADLQQMGQGWLYHVHLHNNNGTRDDHTILKGNMDVKRILTALHAVGYSGKVIVESSDPEDHGVEAVLEALRQMSP